MDMNKFAKDITKKEGLKKSISIAQVKEVIKLVLTTLSRLHPHELGVVLRKYNKRKK